MTIGIDFGTTNSSVALAQETGHVELARFATASGFTDSYRSLLYLEQVRENGRDHVKAWTGPAGVQHYLEAETKGRLIQSLKSFLSSRSLQSTELFGRRVSLEDLIARILKDLREKAEEQFGCTIRSATVGRPVRFVGAENEEQDLYAETRLRAAFQAAGFESIRFQLEPVAAAHFYESTLDHDELILIGDFGGGTSDFSLLRVGPTVRKRGRSPEDLLGNAGLGFAGDAFDARIVRRLVSPALGAGTQMLSMGKLLPVPSWIYTKLEKWHHLSMLKAKDVMNTLRSVRAQAIDPTGIEALIHLVQEDLGYHLHRSVQNLKCDLSVAESARFRFSEGTVELDARVQRSEFEEWIEPDLHRIEACIDALLTSSLIHPRDVDFVFLTGGTSFVPAVRRIFETRFGAARIKTGNEFTSVARGLALSGAR